ncbi:hypothetical protein B7463_g10443, partial [Scytalidium lignicola]
MSHWPERHLAVSPICIACHDYIEVNEVVFALLGDASSANCSGFTKAFPFPQLGVGPTSLEEFMPCRYVGCSRCAESPEGFCVHVECFKLFQRACTTPHWLRLLFTSAAWMNPWSRMAPITWVPPSQRMTLDINVFIYGAIKCGIRNVGRLPTEIVEMIRLHSTAGLMWRYMSVLSLAKNLLVSQPQDLVQLPLIDMANWERGGELCTEIRFRSSVMRISVDALGIKKIERFKEHPKKQIKSNGCFAFIIEKEENLCGFIVELKDNFLRLSSLTTMINMRIWDTPCPPVQVESTFLGKRIRHINFEDLSGLTFFYSSSCGGPCEIHAHTSKEPSAIWTFKRLPKELQQGVYWFFVPLTGGERIRLVVTKSLRNPISNILIYTNLGRFSVLGYFRPEMPNIYSIEEEEEPDTLLYEDPDYGNGWTIPMLDVCGSRKLPLHETKIVTYLPPICPLKDHYAAFYSRASLDSVREARVFLFTEDKGFCLGILFEYYDGTQRAVGQCAPGIWPTVRFAEPKWFYYQHIACNSGTCLSAFFTAEPLPHEQTLGLSCDEMSNKVVTFWMGRKESAIVVH